MPVIVTDALVPVPEQSPDHVPLAVAVNVTDAPLENGAEQVAAHALMPAGLLLTVLDPIVPAKVTVRPGLNVAVHVVGSVVMGTLGQLTFVPHELQAPLQDANVAGAVGVAVRLPKAVV